MATYPATRPTSYKHRDSGSGVGVKILALFLGIAVGVLAIVAVVLVQSRTTLATRQMRLHRRTTIPRAR